MRESVFGISSAGDRSSNAYTNCNERAALRGYCELLGSQHLIP